MNGDVVDSPLLKDTGIGTSDILKQMKQLNAVLGLTLD